MPVSADIQQNKVLFVWFRKLFPNRSSNKSKKRLLAKISLRSNSSIVSILSRWNRQQFMVVTADERTTTTWKSFTLTKRLIAYL
jgi:hypothetical protein